MPLSSSQESSIEKKVQEFVSNRKLFTSVDIGNSLKKSGEWISNREVAQYLRKNFGYVGYSKTLIDVKDGLLAHLYHPADVSADDYTDRDQEALSPSDYTPDIKDFDLSDSSSTDIILLPDDNNMLTIPAFLITKLGYNKGDTIPSDKILVNKEDLPEPTIVNDKGEATVPRACIAWDDEDLKVSVKNDSITFERATT